MAELLDFLKMMKVFDVVWVVVVLAITAAVATLASRSIKKILMADNHQIAKSSIYINLVRGFVWAIGLSIILGTTFKVDVSALIAALGVSGIAISFGLKDSIANVVSGLQITILNLVKPGDNIQVATQSGIVQDITWRHTQILTSTGETVYIPNSSMSSSSLVKKDPLTKVVIKFSVPINLDCEQIVLKAAKDCQAVANEISPVKSDIKVVYLDSTFECSNIKFVIVIDDAGEHDRVRSACVSTIAKIIAGDNCC